jgi:hypothetical protein
MKASPGRPTPSPELQARVQRLVDDLGIGRAAAALGLNRQTVAALAAGLPCRPSTLYQARALAFGATSLPPAPCMPQAGPRDPAPGGVA